MTNVLLVSGSTRAESTNSALLRTARACAPEGMVASLYDGLADLPAFNPDVTPARAAFSVARLRADLAAADGVLFCTPEYAGTLPGSFKNLLDWVVGSGELSGKPVGWINAANGGRGLGAEATLRSVLGYVGATIIPAACVSLPDAGGANRTDGLITDEAVQLTLIGALLAVVSAP